MHLTNQAILLAVLMGAAHEADPHPQLMVVHLPDPTTCLAPSPNPAWVHLPRLVDPFAHHLSTLVLPLYPSISTEQRVHLELSIAGVAETSL